MQEDGFLGDLLGSLAIRIPECSQASPWKSGLDFYPNQDSLVKIKQLPSLARGSCVVVQVVATFRCSVVYCVTIR